MSGKLLTEHHLEFLSLKGSCKGSSESTLAKMPLLEITCPGSYVICTKILCGGPCILIVLGLKSLILRFLICIIKQICKLYVFDLSIVSF